MSRYIPQTQQKYCCVPACLSMIMYRYCIPLMPQDDLAYALGLMVPQEDVWLFGEGKARTGVMPPSGWGTQIYIPEFDINKVLSELNIPLHVDVDTAIGSAGELREKLQTVQDTDGPALLCFDYGKLWDTNFSGGHVCVFDRLEGDDVWLIDPECNVPKNRKVALAKLFEAIDFHGPANSSGVWVITKLSA